MKVTKVNDVYQIAFLPILFPVNCYLVEEEQTLTLIDCALPFSTKGIIETAKQIGKPITNILLTHAHGDHVGALDELTKQIPNVNILLSKRDSKLLKGDITLEEHEEGWPIKGGIPKNIKTTPTGFLKEGDKVGSLLTIETPGHTPGSLSFLDERTNSLIVGDQFQTRAGLAISGQLNFLFPFPAFATWNKQKAIESAQKIIPHQPSILCTGHGPIMTNPIEEIAKVITKG